MITDYQKFRIPDHSGKNHIDAEVNWEEGQECKFIKFTLPDGSKSVVSRDELNEILFAIGDREAQIALTPQKFQSVHWRETVLGIKATKNIRKGEMVNFPLKISFPCTNVAGRVMGEHFLKKDAQKAQKEESFVTRFLKP